jgi:hypothetical protein
MGLLTKSDFPKSSYPAEPIASSFLNVYITLIINKRLTVE